MDPQVKYKNKVVMIGFVKELCEKESPEDLDKIKVRIYGTLNSTGMFNFLIIKIYNIKIYMCIIILLYFFNKI